MNIDVHPTAEISPSANIGKETVIGAHTHIGDDTRLGQHCTIGKAVFIDRGVIIGSHVKISNHVSICQDVTIEDNVTIGPGVCINNDTKLRPLYENIAVQEERQDITTTIRQGAILGANATIFAGLTIGRWAAVGAGSLVLKDIADNCFEAGNPAKLHSFICHCGNTLELFEAVDIGHRKVNPHCRQCRQHIEIPGRLINSLLGKYMV